MSFTKKTQIFKMAHALVRSLKLTLSAALKYAWAAFKGSTLSICFSKETGELRTADAQITSVAANKGGELYAKFKELINGDVQYRSFTFNRLTLIY